jgi:xylulokinase
MAGSLLMGIDVGTLSSKGVLCTPGGEILAQRQVEHGLSIPRPGWAEHDADGVWWHDLCIISQALLAGASASAADVAALGVSALGPDLVPLDVHGRALRPAILYGIDTRAQAEITALEDRYGAREMTALAGMELSAQSVGPKILWLRRHEPALFRQTHYLCSASSFLVYRLCGQYVLDPTTASFFNPLFDNYSVAWSDRYADGIVGDVPLPRLAWPNEVVGEVTPQAAQETGLRPGTAVTAGTIDVVSEALSVGMLDSLPALGPGRAGPQRENVADALRPARAVQPGRGYGHHRRPDPLVSRPLCSTRAGRSGGGWDERLRGPDRGSGTGAAGQRRAGAAALFQR